jgi:hypothetical protein
MPALLVCQIHRLMCQMDTVEMRSEGYADWIRFTFSYTRVYPVLPFQGYLKGSSGTYGDRCPTARAAPHVGISGSRQST